jgi:hypothetical protein
VWAIIVLILATGAPREDSAARLLEVRTLIADLGPRDALRSLFQDLSRWKVLLEDIATGESEWLGVAAEFRAESDAYASETLTMAIQEALPENPTGVLQLVAAGKFDVHDACGMYGFGQIEDERPLSVILALVDKRTDAVSGIAKPELAAARDGCLWELARLRAILEKHGAG